MAEGNVLIAIMFFYTLGLIMGTLIGHPMKNYEKGWDDAKEIYSNWNDGYDTGFKKASEIFQDYDQGFGDGFETGWGAALEQYDKEEQKC